MAQTFTGRTALVALGLAASLVLTTDLSLLAAITGFGAGVVISAAAGRLGAAAFGLFLAAANVVES